MNNETRVLTELNNASYETLKAGQGTILTAIAHLDEETGEYRILCTVEDYTRIISLTAKQVSTVLKPLLMGNFLRESSLMALQGSTIKWDNYVIQEAGKTYTRFNGDEFVAEHDGAVAFEGKALVPNFKEALAFAPFFKLADDQVLYNADAQVKPRVMPTVADVVDDEEALIDDTIPTSETEVQE